MAYLIAILVPAALLTAFIGLTLHERRRGVRLAGPLRVKLDAFAARLARGMRSMSPVDAALRGARRLLGHIIHDIATVTLAAVRATERSLTALVRRLRSTRSPERAETRSGFLKSISYFKRTLRGPEETPVAEATEGK